jgi:hypothetical protein
MIFGILFLTKGLLFGLYLLFKRMDSLWSLSPLREWIFFGLYLLYEDGFPFAQVYEMMAWTNPLHPDAFPGLRKMEAEIVRQEVAPA